MVATSFSLQAGRVEVASGAWTPTATINANSAMARTTLRQPSRQTATTVHPFHRRLHRQLRAFHGWSSACHGARSALHRCRINHRFQVTGCPAEATTSLGHDSFDKVFPDKRLGWRAPTELHTL